MSYSQSMKLLTLCFLLLLYSCSFKGLVIGHLPEIITRRVDKKMNLYDKQEKEFEQNVEVILKEQKKEIVELNNYIQDLDLKSADFNTVYLYLSNSYKKLSLPYIELLAKNISMLDENQIEHLFEVQERENKKYRKRYENKDITIERYKKFFGDLTKEQKDFLISEHSYYSKLNSEWIDRRIEIQKRLKKVLLSKKGHMNKEGAIKTLFIDYTNHSVLIDRRKRAIENFQKIAKIATSDQREAFDEFKNEINGWISVYTEIY